MTFGVLCAWLAHVLVPTVGLLTWAVLIGLVAGNTRAVRPGARLPLAAFTKRLLRVGVVLLGLGLSVGPSSRLGCHCSVWWPRSW